VLRCLAFLLHIPTNSPKFGANCLEPYALLEFKQGSWRYSFKFRVQFENLIQLTKGAKDTIIIQGKLSGQVVYK